MKKIAIALSFISILSAACGDKVPSVVPEDLLVKILTDGEWSVTDYKLNGTDRTPEFSGWRFKYYNTNVVDAKFNGSVTNSGSWSGNQSDMNFSANFPSAPSPVNLVNGTWHVDQPGTRIVVASQTVGSETRVMKLYRE